MAQLAPTTEVIPRRGKGTQPFEDQGNAHPAGWDTVEAELRKGAATFWLATQGPSGAPHVRPLFAAWTGSSFVVTSKHEAAKSRNLRASGYCTITADLGFVHLVVEGHAQQVLDREGLRRASRAIREVFGWPTEVVGEELDAEYGAPTSGGPPYEVYELHPRKAFGFPTADDFEPTRWSFPAHAG